MILLDHPEHARVWNDHMTASMLEKYAVELQRLERALGARWVQTEDGEGHHVLESNLEETLEQLGDPTLSTTPLPGYPWDAVAEGKLTQRVGTTEHANTWLRL